MGFSANINVSVSVTFLSPPPPNVCAHQIIEDWKFVSMVLDRFLLWVFTLSCIGGTLLIICQSPSLYDTRPPIDQQLSEIPLRKNNFQLPPDIVRMTINDPLPTEMALTETTMID